MVPTFNLTNKQFKYFLWSNSTEGPWTPSGTQVVPLALGGTPSNPFLSGSMKCRREDDIPQTDVVILARRTEDDSISVIHRRDFQEILLSPSGVNLTQSYPSILPSRGSYVLFLLSVPLPPSQPYFFLSIAFSCLLLYFLFR